MEYYKINPGKPDETIINRAVAVLREGGVIVYPTDTLYGLGADAANEDAMNRLFLFKRRNRKSPVSLLVNNTDDITRTLRSVDKKIQSDLNKIFPGKITALLANTIPPDSNISSYFRGLRKIGFRVPDSALCRKLAVSLGRPLTTTSANLSGADNVQNIEQVVAQFGNKLDLILDGGDIKSKSGSTIIDFTKEPLLILREGDIGLAELNKKLPGRKFRKKQEKYRIVFVCSGNICRSPMGKAILQAKLKRTKYKKYVEIDSAGTLDLFPQPAHDYALQVTDEKKINLYDHQSKPVSENIINDSGLVICMALNHYRELHRRFPDQCDKIIMLKEWKHKKPLANPSVADPIGHNMKFFFNTYDEIFNEIKRIFPFILSEVKQFIDYNDLGED